MVGTTNGLLPERSEFTFKAEYAYTRACPSGLLELTLLAPWRLDGCFWAGTSSITSPSAVVPG